MPQDRPTAAELLSAIADFLREEATPALDRAEPRLGPAADAREHERLRNLLGRDGTLDELNRLLAQQVRTGQRDERDPALMAHLTATIADKIAIANPKWR